MWFPDFCFVENLHKRQYFSLKVGDVGVCNAAPKKRPPPELRVHPRRLRMRNGLHSSSVVLSCYSMISWKLCCRSRFHETWQHSTRMLYAVCRTMCPYVLYTIVENSILYLQRSTNSTVCSIRLEFVPWHTICINLRAYKHLQTSNHCMLYKFIYILSYIIP